MAKLLVCILGTRNAGKSTTWNTLFGRKVRTGKRERVLLLSDEEYVDAFLIYGSPEERNEEIENILPVGSREHVKVFVVSGSPEERNRYIDTIVPDALPKIVLCSIQNVEHGKKTINYFTSNGYFLYVIWLNPGFGNTKPQEDNLNFEELVTNAKGNFSIMDGNGNVTERANNIRIFIRNWAKEKGLLKYIAT